MAARKAIVIAAGQLQQLQAGDSLEVDGGFVANEAGVDVDFRVEGDSLDHLLFIQGDAAAENMALFASGAPNFQSGDRIAFIGDGTAPSGNPANGVFLWSEGGELKARDASGNVVTLTDPASGAPDIQIFSVPGTYTGGWTKPAGAVTVERHLIAGGGQGASGRCSGAGAIRGGGGGGGAGISAANITNVISGWGGASGGARTARSLCLNANSVANTIPFLAAANGFDGPSVMAGTTPVLFGGSGASGAATSLLPASSFIGPSFGGRGGKFGGGGGGGAGYTGGGVAVSNDGFPGGDGIAIIITYFS